MLWKNDFTSFRIWRSGGEKSENFPLRASRETGAGRAAKRGDGVGNRGVRL